MLNCQNVSTLRKCSTASFCSDFWTYILETLRNFSKTSTRTLYFIVSRRTVIWKLLRTNIRWQPTSHFSTNGIARISAYRYGMQKTPDWMSSLQVHFSFPSPLPPPLLLFIYFPQFSHKWACSQARGERDWEDGWFFSLQGFLWHQFLCTIFVLGYVPTLTWPHRSCKHCINKHIFLNISYGPS